MIRLIALIIAITIAASYAMDNKQLKAKLKEKPAITTVDCPVYKDRILYASIYEIADGTVRCMYSTDFYSRKKGNK